MTSAHHASNNQHLSVVLERAVELKSRDWLKAQDPYCKLQCARREEKSLTITGGGRNPVWNQTFTFNIGPDDNELRIEIWDKDTWSKDDLVGTATASLLQVRQHGRAKMQLPVFTVKHKQHGTLFLDLQLKNTQLATSSVRPRPTAGTSFHSQPSGYAAQAAHAALASATAANYHQPNPYPPTNQYPNPAPTPIPAPAPSQPYGAAPPQWGQAYPQTSSAGRYRDFDPDEFTSIEELQARLARLTAQRDRTNYALMHNYRILQQYANHHDVERRRWYNDLQRSYEDGNRELHELNQEISELQLKINRRQGAQPQPPAANAWTNLSPSNSAYLSYHSINTAPAAYPLTSHPSQPLHHMPSGHLSHHTPEPTHPAQGLNTYPDLSGQQANNLHSMLSPYSSQGLCSAHPTPHSSDVYTVHSSTASYAPSARFNNDRTSAQHEMSTARPDGYVPTDPSPVSHEDKSLVSNRIRPAGGPHKPEAPAATLPPSAFSHTATASHLSDEDEVRRRMEARWRAIQRWKTFMAFVRINYLYANKMKHSVIIEDGPKVAPPPPAPPLPQKPKPAPPPPAPPMAPPQPLPGAPGSPLIPFKASKPAGTALTSAGLKASDGATRESKQEGEVGNGGGAVFRDTNFVDKMRAVRNYGTDWRNTGATGGAAFAPRPVKDAMNFIEELQSRGGHLAKVQADVEKYGDMIQKLAAKVEKANCTAMNDLCEFVDSVNSDLDVLVDVPAVLKHFPEWPEARFDTMQEAVHLYRERLGSKLRAMAKWQVPATAPKAIIQSRMLIDDTRHCLDRLAPEKQLKEKRFKEHGLPWDPKIWTQVHLAAMQLCAQQLKITLDAVKEPSQLTHKQCVDLLHDTLDMQYKVYQMAGGYNREVQELSQEAFETWQKLTQKS